MFGESALGEKSVRGGGRTHREKCDLLAFKK